MKVISKTICFGGQQIRYKHASKVLACEMHFSVFLPPQAAKGDVPVLYWLSGLTCTDENFVTKAGAQRYAAEHGIALVAPDTSPRGEQVPDDPAASWDFGHGAGFYVNATEHPWSEHYHMYDYIVTELTELLYANLPLDPDRAAISGHSMGGHGAITIGLKNPGLFKSISAFSPICAPTQCPWGEKALGRYLGANKTRWQKYDSCELIKSADTHLPLLIDQGDEDDFLTEQLKPELLMEAAEDANFAIELRMQRGYDHSYFFVASFIGDHLRFHASHL